MQQGAVFIMRRKNSGKRDESGKKTCWNLGGWSGDTLSATESDLATADDCVGRVNREDAHTDFPWMACSPCAMPRRQVADYFAALPL
jgi:hypothetical protein